LFQFIRSIAITLGLFVAVYAPAFVITALLRSRIEAAIPLVITISVGIAFGLVLLFSKPPNGVAEFGFRLPRGRYVWLALEFGVPLGFLAGWLTQIFPSAPPYDLSRFTGTMILSYFVVGASIQEEIIFRGLLQTMFQRILNPSLVIMQLSVGYSVIAIALLFGLIHLPEGLLVAFCALVLGLIAGELRRRSGSIVPAMIVHALFNTGSALFELPLRH
jgi:membrane protease YdiL (CAAX protease family)